VHTVFTKPTVTVQELVRTVEGILAQHGRR
jgi:hypothetical protein